MQKHIEGIKPQSRGFPQIVRLVAGAIATALVFIGPARTLAEDDVPCGGPFGSFVNGLKIEAIGLGHDGRTVQGFFSDLTPDPEVIRRDRSQGIFRKSFIEFSKLVMQEYRIRMSADFESKHRAVFDRVEEEYGVDRGVLLSFLALETDFGLVQGDHNTLRSLVTLAHDCRRPGLFRPHVFAALELYERGDFDPVTTVGAWAGEIGMIQMLPLDVLEFGRDGDGDGRVDLRNSVWDALTTTGEVLRETGWKPYQPWLVEVTIPQTINWTETGLSHTKSVEQWQRLGVMVRSGSAINGRLKASLLLPHGRFGPAFLAFDNYRLYFEWNRSFVYATTSAFFATLLTGSPMYIDGSPPPPLSDAEIKRLQTRLKAIGHDVGAVDGIVGSRTRAAIQAEQARLGLPADAWPTHGLLDLL